MPRYTFEYGDDQNEPVIESIRADQVVSEDGWLVFLDNGDAVQRLREDHVGNLMRWTR